MILRNDYLINYEICCLYYNSFCSQKSRRQETKVVRKSSAIQVTIQETTRQWVDGWHLKGSNSVFPCTLLFPPGSSARIVCWEYLYRSDPNFSVWPPYFSRWPSSDNPLASTPALKKILAEAVSPHPPPTHKHISFGTVQSLVSVQNGRGSQISCKSLWVVSGCIKLLHCLSCQNSLQHLNIVLLVSIKLELVGWLVICDKQHWWLKLRFIDQNRKHKRLLLKLFVNKTRCLTML